jgi:hypothetical protein
MRIQDRISFQLSERTIRDILEFIQILLFRGRRSRNKVSVGEPAEGSLSFPYLYLKKNIRIIVFIEKNDLKKIFTFFLFFNKESELLKIFIKNFYKNLKRKKKK